MHNLKGQKFGKLTVICKSENINKRTAWLCKCDCGQKIIVKTGYLTNGDTKSCGCKKGDGGKQKLHNIIGEKYGRLLVISRTENNKYNKPTWECLCDCGNIIIVNGNLLKNKNTQSCGCLKLEETIKRSTKHKLCNTKLYKVWAAMKGRCYNKNATQYNDYGGRGIIVCDDWKNDFQKFYDWSINNEYDNKLTLDRINVNGNYEPSNCRWVSMTIQARNKRISKRNKSGVAGVFFEKTRNKYQASITISLGEYDTLEEAAEARKAAEIKYWGKSR